MSKKKSSKRKAKKKNRKAVDRKKSITKFIKGKDISEVVSNNATKCKTGKVSPKGKIFDIIYDNIITIQQITMPILLNSFYSCVVSLQFFNIGSFFLEFLRDEPLVMTTKGFIFLLSKLIVTIIVSIGTFGIPFETKIHSSLLLIYLINVVFYVSGIIINEKKINLIIEKDKNMENISITDKFKLYVMKNSWVMISLTCVTLISLFSLKFTNKI